MDDQYKLSKVLLAASMEDGVEDERFWAAKYLNMIGAGWLDIQPLTVCESPEFCVCVNVSKTVGDEGGLVEFDREKLIYAVAVAARLFHHCEMAGGGEGGITIYGWPELEKALSVEEGGLSMSELGLDIINLVVETIAITVDVLDDCASQWTTTLKS